MKYYKKPNGTVKQFINNQYFIELDGGSHITISYDTMHRNVDLSAIMINDVIPSGTRMVFYLKDQDTAYPDASVYPLKTPHTNNNALEEDAKRLLDGLLPFSLPAMNMNVFMTTLLEVIKDANPFKIQEIFSIYYSERSDEEKQRQIRSILNIPEKIAEESECFEKKGYMLHTAGDNPDTVDGKNMQLREIAEELVSFANDPTTGKGTVLVGVDEDGRPTGMELEIARAYPGMNRDQFQATVILNVFSSFIKDASFMQSLRFDWRQMEGHLVCLITTTYIGLPIIIGDGIMPYRCSNTKSVAKGNDIVKMIWNAAIAYSVRQQKDVNTMQVDTDNNL